MKRVPEPKIIQQLSSRIYYGWVVVLVCSLTLLVAFGVRLSFSVFFVALVADFNWSRAGAALIYSLSMMVFTIASTFVGFALDRWGVRRVFASGTLVLALGLWLSSNIITFGQLVLAYGVVAGLGITVLGLGPQAGVIARWFRRRRGLALGIAFAGTGLGSLLLIPGAELAIRQWGWRGAYRALSILALALVPFILIFLRSYPFEMGLQPDGAPPPVDAAAAAVLRGDWTMSRVVRSPAFWLIMLAGLGAIGPLRMLTVHQLARIVDAGFDRLYGATVLGAAGAVTALSFILFGTLSDRIGRRLAYALGSVSLVIAIGLLANLPGSDRPVWLWFYALTMGLGEGARSSLVTAAASDLFPGPALGTLNGAIGAAFGLGAAFFPWGAGWLYDRLGNYDLAFELGAAAIVASLLALWLAPAVQARWLARP